MRADPSLLADLAQAGPFGRQALIVAHGELGVREDRGRPNRGPRVDQYLAGVDGGRADLLCALRSSGKPCLLCDLLPAPAAECDGSQWCGRFARWCFDRASQVLQPGQPLLLAGWASLASALKWRDQARLHRSWVETPAPGRVGLHLNGDGSGHVTLIPRVKGRVITTIAGNEDNEVATRERPPEYFNGGFVELG